MPRIVAGLLGSFALAYAVPSRADVSHHQGSNPGQVSLAGLDRLAVEDGTRLLDLCVFTSFLHASEKLDEDAGRFELAGGGSTRNYGLHVYGEVRLRRAVAVSLLSGVQRLDIDAADGGDTIWSLSDTLIRA